MSSSSSIVRVAAVQAEPEWFDLQAGVKKTCDLIADAAAGGAKLVSFPECFIPGFSSNIAQSRLVTTMQGGLEMESNTVLFSTFEESNDCVGRRRGHGVVVCDFVDEDDRYPFRPESRIRRDLSSVLEVTSCT